VTQARINNEIPAGRDLLIGRIAELTGTRNRHTEKEHWPWQIR
jgi:hypothetical protein